MSVLEKIREKSLLLLVVIGGALVLFILGDMLTSGQTFFQEDMSNIGEVAGEGISGEEFEARLQEQEQNHVRRTGQSLDESTQEMLRQQTFDLIVRERIMREQYNELGLVVTDRELYEMVSGANPHPSVRQAFTDPQTGTFDPTQISRYLQMLDADETGERKRDWINFEKQLREQRIDEKYRNLISKGLYIPGFLAKHDYISKNKSATARFVANRYSTVPDSTVVVTDEDIEKYYEEHKESYKQDPSRKIEYVVFDVRPSQADIQVAMTEATELLPQFVESENDTDFVRDFSEEPEMPTLYSYNERPPRIDSAFFYGAPGAVHGPFIEDDMVKISKLSSIRMESDSVKARHILINIEEGDTLAATAKIDSIKNLIATGTKFEDIARAESDDVSSGANGGDLGWFTQGRMVQPFNDAAFGGNVGDLATVTSQFGIHLIEIQEKSPEVRKIELSTVNIPIAPGTETKDLAYNRSQEFYSKAQTAEDFDRSAEENKLQKVVADNVLQGDRSLMNMNNSRQIVRWAYEAEEGAVKSFDTGSEFVIAVLKEVREEGYAKIEHVRPELELEAIKEKKADQFIATFNDALAGGASNLDALSTKVGMPVETASNITFASFSVQGLGREPAFTGTVFGLKPNVVSAPVKGETAVFVISVDSFSDITVPQDLTSEKSQLGGTLTNRVNYEVYEALKEKAEVKDNVGRFY